MLLSHLQQLPQLHMLLHSPELVRVSPTGAPLSCSASPTTQATPTHKLRLAGNLNAIQDKTRNDCTKLELEDNNLYHSTQLWPTVKVLEHVASLPSQVIDFNITPPTTHLWCLSIDAHQMHVAHVTFWNFGIRDEFGNRQTTSIPKLELRSPFYLVFNFFTLCFFTRLGS